MVKKYLVLLIALGILSGGFAYAVTADSSTSLRADSENLEVTGNTETKLEITSEPILESNEENKETTDESSERVLPTVNKRTVEAKVTVQGWDVEKKAAIEGTIQNETNENPYIDSVAISENTLTIDYLIPAKLFGFISVQMHTVITSDENANVKVQFPWWKFLATSQLSKSKVEAELNYVFQNNQTDLEFLKAKASQDRQVEIFIKISNTMHEMSKSIIANIKA